MLVINNQNISFSSIDRVKNCSPQLSILKRCAQHCYLFSNDSVGNHNAHKSKNNNISMNQYRNLSNRGSPNARKDKQTKLSQLSWVNMHLHIGKRSIPTNKQNIQLSSGIKQSENIKLMLENKRPASIRKQKQGHQQEKLRVKHLYASLYNMKHIHLKTQATSRQRSRFMRKLTQTINDSQFRAVNYGFDAKCCSLVFSYILTNRSITKIILDNNPLGDQGILQLSQLIGKIDLEQLSLVSVGMGNKGAAVLFKALEVKRTIKKLNISSLECSFKNKVSAEGVHNLKQLLNSTCSVLHQLHMDYILLGNQGLKNAFQAVQSSALQELTLGRNDLTSKRMQIFVAGMAKVSLLRLDLSRNMIGNEGCKYLSEVLGLNYGRNRISINLAYLNLANNQINSIGLQGFCTDMCNNQTLQTLVLDHNPLSQGERFFNIRYYLTKSWSLKRLSLIDICCSQKDVKFLSEGVQTSRSLQQLGLSKNQIDGQSLGYLFSMLSRNKSLKRLKLNSCKISDASLLKNEFQITGASYQRIQQIEMENNYIGNKGGSVLKKLVSNNVNIITLGVNKNCMGQKILISIKQILEENQRKRPFDLEFQHLQSMAAMCQQQKVALKAEIDKTTNRQQYLTKLIIVADICTKQIIEQSLNAQVRNEKKSINRIRRKKRGNGLLKTKSTEASDENGQFLTAFSNKSEQIPHLSPFLQQKVSIEF